MTVNMAIRLHGLRIAISGRACNIPKGQLNHCPALFHTACKIQHNADQSPNDRTTHFGFETVPESAKESKGDLKIRAIHYIY